MLSKEKGHFNISVIHMNVFPFREESCLVSAKLTIIDQKEDEAVSPSF